MRSKRRAAWGILNKETVNRKKEQEFYLCKFLRYDHLTRAGRQLQFNICARTLNYWNQSSTSGCAASQLWCPRFHRRLTTSVGHMHQNSSPLRTWPSSRLSPCDQGWCYSIIHAEAYDKVTLMPLNLPTCDFRSLWIRLRELHHTVRNLFISKLIEIRFVCGDANIR